MTMHCSRFLGGALVLLATQPCLAQNFQAPAAIDFGGSLYKQAHKEETEGRGLYEYTTDGESIDASRRLLTLNYTPGNVSDPLTWAKAWIAKFDIESPKPNSYYFFRPKQEAAYAQIITRPDAKRPYYESSVWKSFHLPECGGLVVLQYAEKFPGRTRPPPADPKSDEQLRETFPKNIEAAEILDAFAWQPTCGKAEN
jgi:hypothetical protein